MDEPRRERKVVTVLFADLVGFTARAEELDPEDVEAILRPYHERLREELERHGGTVEKFIGDAVMAVFGAPQAHEDDPERALRAAIAIRDWALEQDGLEVRIAVNTGEALVNLDAKAEHGEAFVAGDVVNTAARMQSAAPVNGVVVGETTRRATGGVVEYRELRPIQAKGKAAPVSVWEALAARLRFGVDVVHASAAPLVGRDRELTLLKDAFARARAAREPQLVTLIGVPGIGKSRLVYELMQFAADEPELIRWRQGRCLPYGEGVTYWGLGEIVKSQAGIFETDDADLAAQKLHAAVVDVLGDSDDHDWVESHLRPLIGLSSAAPPSEAREREAFAAWTRFFEALGEDVPLVLVVEDLHWADQEILDFVDELVDRARDVPLLVVATARPELLERRPGWGGGKANALTLSLPALSDDETARLLGALIGRAVLPAETQHAVLARAEGNPLFAEQYARMLVEHGDVGEIPLPESVQGIIAARLDALSPREKALMQQAAVHGKVFWMGAVGDGDVGEVLRSLERKEFLRRQRRSSVAGETEYTFRHVLLRDVAYAQIPRSERATKHMRAADWIDTLTEDRDDHVELLADHLLRALELTRAAGQETAELARRTRVALRDAGVRALGLNAATTAVRYLNQALELWPKGDPDRGYVLVELGRSRFVAEEEGAEELTAAADLLASRDPETAAEAKTLLVEIAWKRAERDEAFRHLDDAVALVADRPPSAAKAHVLSTQSRYAMLAGDNDEAIESGTAALEMAERLGLDEVRAHALNNIGVSRFGSGDKDGIADIEKSIEIARSINSPEVLRGYINLIAVRSRFAPITEVERIRHEALDLVERFQHPGQERWLRGGVPWALYSLGRWDAALAGASAFIAESAQSPHYLEADSRNVRALIHIARGEDERALADTEKALEMGRRAKDPQAVGPALFTRLTVLLAVGDRQAANRLFDEVLERISFSMGTPMIVGVRAAEFALDLAREEELRRALESSDALHREIADMMLDREFVRAADIVASNDDAANEALIRLRAAESLAASGRRAEADAQLKAALEFFRSVRATRYIRRAEQLLAAAS